MMISLCVCRESIVEEESEQGERLACTNESCNTAPSKPAHLEIMK